MRTIEFARQWGPLLLALGAVVLVATGCPEDSGVHGPYDY